MHRIADELKNIRESENADDLTCVIVRRHQQAVVTPADQSVNGLIRRVNLNLLKNHSHRFGHTSVPYSRVPVCRDIGSLDAITNV
jgi:hypothetical protein